MAGLDVRHRLEEVLGRGAVDSAFQPVVALDDRRVVGYEALSRPAAGAALERPDQLFAAAREHDLADALDWACSGAALRRVLGHPGFDGARRLFLNVEPETLARPLPDDVEQLWARARNELDVVLEVNERALAADPAGVLGAVQDVRERGWGVALDDVGADLPTLALLPLVGPDVIKVDVGLVLGRPTSEIAAILSAVTIERERTGATVLAERVEAAAHVELARAFGATLAQGHRFGRAGPLPETLPPPGPRLERRAHAPAYLAATPFELLHRDLPVQRARRPLLHAMSERLERQAVALGPGALVVGTFETARFLGPGTRARYRELAEAGAFVAAFAPDLDADETADGVRTGALSYADDVTGLWNVVVIGHHFGAVLAVDPLDPIGDRPDPEREFAFVLTHDRVLAVESARILIDRVPAVALRPPG